MKPARQTLLRFPASALRDVPPGALDLARRRTDFAMPLILRHPLDHVLASAYLQGIEDAVAAIMARPAGRAFLDDLSAALTPAPEVPADEDEPWPI